MPFAGTLHSLGCRWWLLLAALSVASSLAQRQLPCAPGCSCFCPAAVDRPCVVSCVSADLTTLPAPLSFSVSSLELKKNKITSLGPRYFADHMNVSHLRQIGLASNLITMVDVAAFESLQSLYALELGGNRIRILPPELFSGCPNIQILGLSHNPLFLPTDGPFLRAPSLSDLDLRTCGLATLPETTFTGTPNLRKIYLDKNPEIEQVNTSAFAMLEHLERLTVNDAAGMRLEGSEPLLVHELQAKHACGVLLSSVTLPTLKFLGAAGCLLSELPPIIAQSLNSLQLLDYAENNLGSWNSSVVMPSLNILQLRNNPFDRLDSLSPQSVPFLKQLHMAWVNLKIAESGPILEAPELELLRLPQCNINMLPTDALSGVPQLNFLNLNQNKLRTLPVDLFDPVPLLQELYLSDNLLESLPEALFVNNHRLDYLILSGNPLLVSGRELQLPASSSLYLLGLDRMGLQTVQPNWFQRTPNVTNLTLVDNQIVTLPENVFESMKHLHFLNLTGNPLNCDAALLPFYEWTRKRGLQVMGTCAKPRGWLRLMDYLQFDGDVDSPTRNSTAFQKEELTASTANTQRFLGAVIGFGFGIAVGIAGTFLLMRYSRSRKACWFITQLCRRRHAASTSGKAGSIENGSKQSSCTQKMSEC